jgi:hypothetical protein
MTRPKLNEQEIERKLRSASAPHPPSHLLDRLKADIPERMMFSSPALERRPQRLWRNSWAVAASVLALAGMSYVVVRTMESAGVTESAPFAARTAAEAPAPDAAPAAAPPAPMMDRSERAVDAAVESQRAPQAKSFDRARAERPGATPAAAKQASRPVQSLAAESLRGEPVAGAVAGGALADTGPPPPVAEAITVTSAAPAAPPPPPAATPPGRVQTAEASGAYAAPQSQARIARKVEAKSGGGGAFVEAAADPSSTFGLRVGGDSWAAVRAALLRDRLPEGGGIREEEIINHFDYGDEADRGRVSVAAEGAPAPFGGARQYVMRIAVSSGAGRPASGALGYVRFNPDVVESYRLVGYERAAGAAEGARVDLPPNHRLTVLYELRLAASPAGQKVATVHLEYTDAAKRNMVVTTDLSRSGFASTWAAASPSLRLASLAGKWAELLKGSPFARGVQPREIMARVQQLSGDFAGDTEVADFVALTAATVRLME